MTQEHYCNKINSQCSKNKLFLNLTLISWSAVTEAASLPLPFVSQCLTSASTEETPRAPTTASSSSDPTTPRPWRYASTSNKDQQICLNRAWTCQTVYFIVNVCFCVSAIRACAVAALKDVSDYFNRDLGQVVVSKDDVMLTFRFAQF